jgi:hypothetical protein
MNDDSQTKGEIQILLKYFESARANVVTRLAARDNCILLYLAAVAGIMTAALTGAKEHYEAMLVIPLIAAAAAAFVSQHNLVMDLLYLYIARNIAKPIRQRGFLITPWELSEEYKSNRHRSSRRRLTAEATIILGPAAIAIATCFFTLGPRTLWIAAPFSIAAFCVAVVIVGRSIRDAKQHLSDLSEA